MLKDFLTKANLFLIFILGMIKKLLACRQKLVFSGRAQSLKYWKKIAARATLLWFLNQ